MNAQEFYNQNKDKPVTVIRGHWRITGQIVGYRPDDDYHILLRIYKDKTYGAPLHVFKAAYQGIITSPDVRECENYQYMLANYDEIILNVASNVTRPINKPCSCDLTTLMRSGCKCGGI